MRKYQRLRLILGDQLNAAHRWFRKKDDRCLYLIAELLQETNYVRHHIQKLCAFFAAMASFAGALKQSGHHVLHLTLDDTASFDDLPALLKHVTEKYGIAEFEYQQPDEYRLQQQLSRLSLGSGVTINRFESEHFMLPFDELESYFTPGKAVRMEAFYRKMRKRFDILMEGDQPAGGQWNFDSDNRQSLKKADLAAIPEPILFANPVTDILQRIDRHQVAHFGVPTDPLIWPVTRKQSLQVLKHFCRFCLPSFGRFQDAMTANSEHRWSLYHSRLSFALNTKMLHPKQVIDAAIAAWQASLGTISIAQVEGFVRQILGWREFVRGMYWANMPEYRAMNHFNAQRTLPAFFWTGETRMRCLQQAISQSLDFAYAHHIQRLMVTGNFCLLAGIDPDQVDDWYLGIYLDAIEWVELPNARGMSQFGDGGLVASKPYAASGNYINKMSDYCRDCHYSVKEKTTEDACPLNSLYWHFMLRHRDQLAVNHRTGVVYKGWDKRSSEEQRAVLDRAEWCLENLDAL